MKMQHMSTVNIQEPFYSLKLSPIFSSPCPITFSTGAAVAVTARLVCLPITI